VDRVYAELTLVFRGPSNRNIYASKLVLHLNTWNWRSLQLLPQFSTIHIPLGMENSGVELPGNRTNDPMQDDAVPMDMRASDIQPQANGSFPKPSLLDAFQAKSVAPSFSGQSPLESTPGISGDINDKLVLGSTSEETDDDDSLLE
jgi:hypothetical protein